MTIWFKSKSAYAFLSNFSAHGFTTEDGVRWPSVEHYYQAAKFDDSGVVHAIRSAPSSLLARMSGRDPALTPRADWHAVKEAVMKRALQAKFEQSAEVRAALLLTGDEPLVHESSDDSYWGRSRQGHGENRLGVLLEQLRAEIRGVPQSLGPVRRLLPPYVLLHVPHASTFIPAEVLPQYVLDIEDLWREVVRMTDHFAGELCARGVDPGQVAAAGVNRLVVDVERFLDAEPMEAVGMAAVYERTADGGVLRHRLNDAARLDLIEKWYRTHHERLSASVQRILGGHGQALIIDCHTFSSQPLACDLNQDEDRPQICIGTDAFHTPPALVHEFVTAFRDAGFVTMIDRPFAGSMVPGDRFQIDRRVFTILVEVNRSLYMDEATGRPNAAFGAVACRVQACIDQASRSWAGR